LGSGNEVDLNYSGKKKFSIIEQSRLKKNISIRWRKLVVMIGPAYSGRFQRKAR